MVVKVLVTGYCSGYQVTEGEVRSDLPDDVIKALGDSVVKVTLSDPPKVAESDRARARAMRAPNNTAMPEPKIEGKVKPHKIPRAKKFVMGE